MNQVFNNQPALRRFQHELLQKRRNLTAWLSSASARSKDIRLGPRDESAVKTHLEVLDSALARVDDQTFGICEVCHEPIERSGLLEMDYACCVCLDHFSAAERERLEFELELSTKVQQALLPQQAMDIPGLEVAAFSRPATIVGGDYFDFYRFHDGAYGLLVGDVAGHGMASSLIMASLQASLRILVPDYEEPGDVLRRLNQLFYHNINMTNFVSLFLGHFDPQTKRLSYSSAGHNPPLLYRPGAGGDEPSTWLRPTGAAIGLVEGATFGKKVALLEPDTILLLYTDGVTEAMNEKGEEFGQQRLAAAVQQNSSLPIQELVRNLRLRLQDFSGGRPLADDTTIVAYRSIE
ncbi:MAG: SpoIIE family protein phosphatase [Chloroflexota bacterium]